MRASPAAPSQEIDLTGRMALVTSGSRGLGRAIAAAYVAVGADVVAAGSKAKPVTTAAAEIAPVTCGKVVGIPAHVRPWSD